MKRFIKFLRRLNLQRKLAKYSNVLRLGEDILLQPGFSLVGNISGKQIKVRIGAQSVVGSQFIFERDGFGTIELGERVHSGQSTRFISISNIHVGNDVTISYGCTFYDHDSHSIDWYSRSRDTLREIQDQKDFGDFLKNKDWSVVASKPITIENKVWIGFDATILKGVNIGEGAVVGAKSVVTRDVAPYTLVAGNPARFIKNLKRGEDQ